MARMVAARSLIAVLIASFPVPIWPQTGYQYEEMAPDPVLKTPATLDSMMMRAGYEQRHRDCLDAGLHIDAVLALKPDWAGARELRLYCERQEERRVEEMDDLNKLIDLQQDYWRRWSDRADLHEKNLEQQMALEDVSRAIELLPWGIDLYIRRGDWKEKLQDYGGAFADAEEVHRLAPESVRQVKEMARLALLAGQSEPVVARYRKLAEIGDPKPEDSPRKDDDLSTAGMGSEELTLRAGYALTLGKLELELKFLSAALAVQPGLIPALERRVEIARMEKQWIALNPRQDVERLIELNPKRADYYRFRIEFRPFPKDPEATLRDMGTIIRLEPYEARNYYDRAYFELGLKDPDSAIEDLRHAIDLDPSNAQYCYRLSKAYAQKKALLTEALALNWALIGEPDNAVWLRERAKLP
ncbi:hypothetical protein RBB77_22230 [Tunturibacter psychrotolerans]|uniref:Tetratricopeptide repeat protein n=1 Tax=Tunturiibacter psychrotolerans TaxID=3069686 RepID=A0AAU7ZQ80_9BACT